VKLYLAHPIIDNEKIRQWQLSIKDSIPHLELVNPFYDGVERKDIKRYNRRKNRVYLKTDFRKIVDNDLDLIKSCEGVLAIVTKHISIGTPMEIFFNAHVLQRPTFLIILEKNLRVHPWLQYYSTKTFESLREFERWIKKNPHYRFGIDNPF
jgi:nucleoside 2-deoxyribosyltransferase